MLSQYKTDIEAFDKYNDTSLNDIMEFYSIKKKEYEKNEVFYKENINYNCWCFMLFLLKMFVMSSTL